MCAEYVWAKMAGVACLSAALTQSILMTSNHMLRFMESCANSESLKAYVAVPCISIALLPSKCRIAELPLKVKLIHMCFVDSLDIHASMKRA